MAKDVPEKPKRPLNAYFKFRGKRLKELADEDDRVATVKSEWDNMSEADKSKL